MTLTARGRSCTTTVTDDDGATFTARSDFRHESSGVLIEFKASRLNGLKTKANADKAVARLRQAEASGFVHDGNRQAATLKAAWSDSIHKQAAVVAALSAARVVLVLKEDPDEKEARRLDRAGIFWRTLAHIPAYAFSNWLRWDWTWALRLNVIPFQ